MSQLEESFSVDQ